MLNNWIYWKKEGVFKELFTMPIVEFEGSLIAITAVSLIFYLI